MVPGWQDSPPTPLTILSNKAEPRGDPPVCTAVMVLPILPVDNRGLHFCCWWWFLLKHF